MTGDLLIDSMISLVGIAVLVGLARLLFPAPPPPVTEASASERLAFDEPDFKPVFWFIDRKGRGALASGDSGEAALVRRLGSDLVTRRFQSTNANIVSTGDQLIISLPDHTVPELTLSLGPDAEKAASVLKPKS